MPDSPPPPRHVLIVGGGIGGAVLGDRLAARGCEVTICERHLTAPRLARPEILWQTTVERLARCHGGREIVERCVLPLGGLETHVGGRWRPLLVREALRGNPHRPYSAEPNSLREMLLAASPCVVKRGLAWERPLPSPDGSQIAGGLFRDARSDETPEIRADWVIGDDGTHSRVREAAGISLTAKAFPLDFLCFPARWPARHAPDVARLWAAPGLPRIAGALVMPQAPGGVGAGVVLVEHGAQDAARLRALWEMSLERLPEFCDFVADPAQAPIRVGREWGHASRYGGPGVFLLGDALHPTSPAGGQGSNMAVADAVALAALLTTPDPENALMAYEKQRRAANARAVGITAWVARLLQAPVPGLVKRGLLRASLGTVSACGFAPPFLRYPARAFVGGETERGEASANE